jgi:Site-specific DNA methylase
LTRRATKPHRVATHRPALRRRRYKHDDLVAVDLFSGFGGLTQGIEAAGFTTIMAANHNAYKVEIHEANHPHAEHWIADLVDPESSDYHSAADLPPADLLVAGISCVNHSQANTQKAYQLGLGLFEIEDPEYEERVTRSERDRATATCVLQYAAKHHPRMILIECTTELASWGPLVPGKKYGDGSTYRWWLKQLENLGYKHRVLYLNSMFFGVPQSRDRGYWIFWDKRIPAPDLDHRPETWCPQCDTTVQAVWTWKTGIPPTGSVRYGKQYEYRCPSCRRVVIPPFAPSINALDLTDLGTRIGDRPLKKFTDPKTGKTILSPLAPATMARAERCRQRLGEFPAVLMPAKSQRGSERHLWQPLTTQTSQQETALLATGQATLLAVNNFQGAPRGADEPLPTQGGSETLSMLSTGIVPFRKNTVPTTHAEAMPTVTSDQIPGMLTAAGLVQFRQGIDRRVGGLDRPLNTVVADGAGHGVLFSGWHEHDETKDAAAFQAEWREILADLPLEDCYFRMLREYEIGVGCGFDVDFPGRKGTFVVWGSPRNQVDGFGNAVSPPVGQWIGERLRMVLHSQERVA